MKKSKNLFGRLDNKVRKESVSILSTVGSFLVSFIRRPFLWPCGRRQSFATKLALGAKFAKYTKLTKTPLRNLRLKISVICEICGWNQSKQLNYAKQSQFSKKSNGCNISSNNELQRKIENGHLVKTNPNKANLQTGIPGQRSTIR
jgi:hypothetical protein